MTKKSKEQAPTTFTYEVCNGGRNCPKNGVRCNCECTKIKLTARSLSFCLLDKRNGITEQFEERALEAAMNKQNEQKQARTKQCFQKWTITPLQAKIDHFTVVDLVPWS